MIPLPSSARERRQGIRVVRTVMRQLNVIVAALAAATLETHAGTLDWVFDVVNDDEIARGQAQSLVWDGVPHPLPAYFKKVKMLDKDWPFYLFHVVLSTPGSGAQRDRSSYLVCFRLAESTTEFRILTVIQYASDPPTEREITIDKRLNRWPVAPPWEVGDDLPRKIKGSGLSIVLDKCRAESDQEHR